MSQNIEYSGGWDWACTAVLGFSLVQASCLARWEGRGGTELVKTSPLCRTTIREAGQRKSKNHFFSVQITLSSFLSLGKQVNECSTRDDVAMLVEWGVDYLKYDNCFPRMVSLCPFISYQPLHIISAPSYHISLHHENSPTHMHWVFDQLRYSQ